MEKGKTQASLPVPWQKKTALLFADVETAFFHDLQHIFPHHTLRLERIVPYQIGRMESCHQGDTLECRPSAAYCAHFTVWIMAEQSSHGDIAQCDDDFRTDDFDLSLQIGEAETHLLD